MRHNEKCYTHKKVKGLRYEIQRLVHKVGHNCRIPLQMKGFNNFDLISREKVLFFPHC